MNDAQSKRSYLRGMAIYCNVTIRTYSPGDGTTRYRFFAPDDKSDYFGPSSGMGTALGISDAISWMEGYRHGFDQGKRFVQGREMV